MDFSCNVRKTGIVTIAEDNTDGYSESRDIWQRWNRSAPLIGAAQSLYVWSVACSVYSREAEAQTASLIFRRLPGRDPHNDGVAFGQGEEGAGGYGGAGQLLFQLPENSGDQFFCWLSALFCVVSAFVDYYNQNCGCEVAERFSRRNLRRIYCVWLRTASAIWESFTRPTKVGGDFCKCRKLGWRAIFGRKSCKR